MGSASRIDRAWLMRLARGGTLIFAVGGLSGGSLGGSAAARQAAFPGRGAIAFTWNADTRVKPQSCQDIFSMTPNGSDRQRLTSGCPWSYSDPAYSANGKQIVFVRSNVFYSDRGAGIYIMNADGSHVRRITDSTSDEDPSFSPDGGRVIFDRFLKASGHTQVFLASTDGSRVSQLTHGNGAVEATFSPNGREIAFVAGSGYSIDIMRSDGSHIRQLAHVRRQFGWYGDPGFSPDGRLIVFICGVAPGLGSIAQVCVMRADGTHMAHLTPAGRTGPVVSDAVFSPDGRRIAFVAFKPCRQPSCNQTAFVYTMSTDGSHIHAIYDLGPHQEGSSLGVAWQPFP